VCGGRRRVLRFLNDSACAFLAIPDNASRDAIGPNPYDPSRARPRAVAEAKARLRSVDNTLDNENPSQPLRPM
jgi:hypothetical protein